MEQERHLSIEPLDNSPEKEQNSGQEAAPETGLEEAKPSEAEAELSAEEQERIDKLVQGGIEMGKKGLEKAERLKKTVAAFTSILLLALDVIPAGSQELGLPGTQRRTETGRITASTPEAIKAYGRMMQQRQLTVSGTSAASLALQMLLMRTLPRSEHIPLPYAPQQRVGSGGVGGFFGGGQPPPVEQGVGISSEVESDSFGTGIRAAIDAIEEEVRTGKTVGVPVGVQPLYYSDPGFKKGFDAEYNDSRARAEIRADILKKELKVQRKGGGSERKGEKGYEDAKSKGERYRGQSLTPGVLAEIQRAPSDYQREFWNGYFGR